MTECSTWTTKVTSNKFIELIQLAEQTLTDRMLTQRVPQLVLLCCCCMAGPQWDRQIDLDRHCTEALCLPQ